MPEPEPTTDIGQRMLGLTGWWASLGKLGFAGIVGGVFVWLIMVHLPAQHEHFHAEIKAERDAARIEAEKSREHGNRAAKEIGEAIREQTHMILQSQLNTHENQRKIIDALRSK